MTYDSYAEYKSSGEQWLKELPSHWSVEKISHHCQLIGSGTTPSASSPIYYEGDINWVTTSELREKPIGETKNKLTDEALKDYSSLKFYPAGSVIIAMYGATIGRLGWLTQPATVNQACCVYANSTKLSQRYIFYWLLAVRNDLIAFASGGGQQNLNQEFLRSIKTFVPPMLEQQKIAAFLDRKTAEIDTLIAKKRRLLDLLTEKRTALITRAVTKGLNPDAPMKDSGIEWLGEIPAHWDVARLKNITQLESGHTPSKSKPEFWVDCDIPWVSLRDTKFLADNDYIKQTHTYINRAGLAGSSARLLPAGTVILTRDATVGLVAVTEVEMAVSQHLIAWIPSEKIDKDYLLFVFESMREYLHSLEFGSTVRTIGMDDIRRLAGPVPPVSEQLEIVDYVLAERGRLKDLEARVYEAIEKLKEYRSALITNAVTGQIKVA